MTPQQDSLSGVIICPAKGEGQRLRVNSFTTTNGLITRRKWLNCQQAWGVSRLPSVFVFTLKVSGRF